MSNLKKIDWLNHFLEFIVVVIGILLAFQLNTCRENTQEQSLVDQHFTSIVEETKLNKMMVTESISLTEGLIKTADTLLVAIKRKDPLPKINGLSLRMLSLNYTYFKKNAYNSLISSGDVRFMKNFQQKEKVIGLYEYYNWAEGLEKMTRETFTQYFFPFVIDEMDLANGTPQSRETYEDKRYRNIIGIYRFALKARIGKQQETLEKTNTFLEQYSNNSEESPKP